MVSVSQTQRLFKDLWNGERFRKIILIIDVILAIILMATNASFAIQHAYHVLGPCQINALLA